MIDREPDIVVHAILGGYTVRFVSLDDGGEADSASWHCCYSLQELLTRIAVHISFIEKENASRKAAQDIIDKAVSEATNTACHQTQRTDIDE